MDKFKRGDIVRFTDDFIQHNAQAYNSTIVMKVLGRMVYKDEAYDVNYISGNLPAPLSAGYFAHSLELLKRTPLPKLTLRELSVEV